MKPRSVTTYLDDYADGYVKTHNMVPGMNVEEGYACPYEMDFDGMFEAFETPNRGVVGGDRTVDDFTPEGVSDGGVSSGAA